jgi:hypothetical protein
MYKQFKTDPRAESEGVFLDYGTFRVRVGRMGGQNKRYLAAVAKASAPHRHAIQAGTLANDTAEAIALEIMAGAVILSWASQNEAGELVPGVYLPDGQIEPYSKEAVKRALHDLPELYRDIQAQARNVNLFLETVREADAKN